MRKSRVSGYALWMLIVFSGIATCASQTAINQVVAFGDSITQGCCAQDEGTDWPALFKSQWVGSPLTGNFNQGIGGQRSGQIAVRMNAYAGQPQQTFAAGFTIPIGGAVNVPFQPGYEPCFQAGMQGPPNVQKVFLTTVVGGTSYEFSCIQSDTVYLATPQTYPSTPIWVPAGTPWLSVTPATITPQTCVNIEAGRNNIRDTMQIERDIASMVTVASRSTSCWSVMTVLNSEMPIEWNSGPVYQNYILPLNTWILSTYGRHAIDIRQPLIDSYDPNNSLDVRDHAHGVPPSSLRSGTARGNTLRTPIADTSSCSFSTAIALYTHGGAVAKVDNEYIYIAAGTNGAYNCVRGYGGSIAAPHSAGAVVNQIDWLHPGINPTTASNPNCEGLGGHRCISDVYITWLNAQAANPVATGRPTRTRMNPR